MTRSGALRRVAVVGASLAGLRACEALRRHGYEGELIVLDAEKHPFYDRPPLSKQWLAGTWDSARLALRLPEAIAALELDLRLGRRAEALDLDARFIVLEGGERVAFDGLVLACGAAARPLPGLDVPPGVLMLRSLDDARVLRAALLGAGEAAGGDHLLGAGELAGGDHPLPAVDVAGGDHPLPAGDGAAGAVGRRLVVVGGGFLGLEVAATARHLGCAVTVVEPLVAPLARVLGDQVGASIGALHERHGVQLLLERGVEAITAGGDAGQAVSVAVSDGRRLEADVVLVAIGARPSTGWLEGSGLELDDGVVCDDTLTAAPGVVVAGDVARIRPASAASWRVEHWTNAAEQGAHAAASLLAGSGDSDVGPTPFHAVPYFWSDQYDVKLQAIGLPDPKGEVAVVDGSLEEGRFVACYGRDGVLVGVVAAGRPRQLMAFRALLETPTPFAEVRTVLG